MIRHLLLALYGLSVLGLSVLIARMIERRWPIENLSQSEINSDWLVTGVNLFLAWLVRPISGACSAAIVNELGGGLIRLPIDGWWYLGSFLTVLLAADLVQYWYHRLAHAVPFLWKMHSFHHSAEAVTFFTGGRHFWLERALSSAFLPILPILFKVPADMTLYVGVVFFLPDSCAHLNIRFRLGHAITWVNSPQWHRIHHSILLEHRDKNFAGLLPLWDIIFRTAWIPGKDEYPPTGLETEGRVGVIDSIIWPFRHLRHR